MRVFLSWSGSLSEQIAEEFRRWLPSVLQTVKPYFSPKDIEKGARWSTEISKELSTSSVCIIFLTRENLTSNWIMFEAGAISKSIDKSKVCPILFDIEPTDVQGPLNQFQLTKFGKAELRKLFETINTSLGDLKLEEAVSRSVFDKWWPDLEEAITSVLKKHNETTNRKTDVRSDRDLIEEILLISRNLSRRDERVSPPPQLPVRYESSAYREIFTSLSQIMESILLTDTEAIDVTEILDNLNISISSRKNLTNTWRDGMTKDIENAKSAMNIMPPPNNSSSTDLDDDIPF